MDLVTMRSTFRLHTSGLGDLLADADVDTRLNNIFAEYLPGDVDGRLHQVAWVKTLAPNVNPTSIPNHIHSFPTGRFWIQGTGGARTGTINRLGFTENLYAFLESNPDYANPAITGLPTCVMRQGKSLYFDVYPDLAYNLLAEARGAQAAALTTDGLSFNHAMCVVTAAAWNYLLEQEDEAGIMREASQYETWKTRLATESQGDYRERTPGRSF